jgi:hypothetical protein
MNREDGFCLIKLWKPLIWSMKDRRKPPSHDSRFGFSEGLRRSMHTALIRTQNMPSPGTHQPPPNVLASFCYLCSPILTACLRLSLSPLHVDCLPNTPLHFFPVFFLDQQNSCSCLLLVHSVVVREPSGFILSPGEPVGTKVHPSISLLLPI